MVNKLLSRFDLAKRSQILLSILGLLVTLSFVLVGFGKAEWAQWMALVGAAFIGLFLWSEGAILTYLQRGNYRSIGFGDVIVWLSFAIGGILILQAIVLFQVIGSAVPDSLLNFLSVNGAVVGGIGGILFLYHMFAPTPR